MGLKKIRPGSENRPSSSSLRAPDADEPSVSALEADAGFVRSCYAEERSRFEGEIWRPTRFWDGRPAIETDDGEIIEPARDSIWPKVAAYFRKIQVEPREFLQTVFNSGELVFAPSPIQLMGQRCREIYGKFRDSRARSVELALPVQISTATTAAAGWQAMGLGVNAAYATVLGQSSLGLSSLFRYCLAASMRDHGSAFRRLAKQFRADAVKQFKQDRDLYLQSWTSFLPPGFVELADSIE